MFKQLKLKSTAVYYYLAMTIFILLWIIGDLVQIIYSSPTSENFVIYLSRFSTIVNLLAMVAVVLFTNSLRTDNAFKSFSTYIIFLLAGGAIGLTFVDSVYSVSYDPNLDFIITSGGLIWIIFMASTVLLATAIFLSYLIKQHFLVDRKDKRATLLMIFGAVLAFLVSLVLYVIYSLLSLKPTLHLELISTALGALLIAIGMLYGGKRALYGSSQLYSIQIFNTSGLSLYAGEFIEEIHVNHQLTSALASAIATLTGKLIGEEIFPREIDIKKYSMILSQKDDYIGFIVCKNPSIQIHQGLKNIIDKFEPNMSNEKIEDTIDNFLPYGKPKSIDANIILQ
ncbi:MAG: hypothetical protein JXA54_11805 [Candidatus Heimdallarchaeota archaeon]|nr:hypothetical protein [Candidatus Heimdallarchaeota archaeon]